MGFFPFVCFNPRASGRQDQEKEAWRSTAGEVLGELHREEGQRGEMKCKTDDVAREEPV